MVSVELWRRLLAGEPADQLLVDLGTSTVTGLRAPGAPDLARAVGEVGHPVLQTIALGAGDVRSLGSDFVRTGLLHPPAEIVDDVSTDPLGVQWLWHDGAAAPLEHPLEDASYSDAARHPRPTWPDRLQVVGPIAAGAPRSVVIADAPCSGILETCFALRGGWQFMLDITDNWRVANAMLDWAMETVAAGYEQLFAGMAEPPDVVLYGDDFGYQGGMFLSDLDFRTFVRPRLRTLMSRLRRMSPAAICFHSCGAIAPILPDLADLGVEALNLQYDAKGMGITDVRPLIPASTVLHGYTDLVALGEALLTDDAGGTAVLTNEILRSGAVVAAPVDSLASESELYAASCAAHFLHSLQPDEIADLRQLGPVVGILALRARQARERVVTPLIGQRPTSVRVSNAGATDPQLTR